MKLSLLIILGLTVAVLVQSYYLKQNVAELRKKIESETPKKTLLDDPDVQESIRRCEENAQRLNDKANKMAVKQGYTHICINGSHKGERVFIVEEQDFFLKPLNGKDEPPTYYILRNEKGQELTVSLLDFTRDYRNIDPNAAVKINPDQ